MTKEKTQTRESIFYYRVESGKLTQSHYIASDAGRYESALEFDEEVAD